MTGGSAGTHLRHWRISLEGLKVFSTFALMLKLGKTAMGATANLGEPRVIRA
jgi:hypothetical protein